jgi:hypothetical protein
VEVDRLREAIEAAGQRIVALDPLPETAIRSILAADLNARPGPHLRLLGTRAAGNPLYLRQVVDGLVRADLIRKEGGFVDIDEDVLHEVPQTIASAVSRKLTFLDTDTRSVLQQCALLGPDFTINDVAVVTGIAARQLMGSIVQALASNVLVDAGNRFTFRHSLLRHALYESMPTALRTELHKQAAHAFAAASSPVERVVVQLLAAQQDMDAWAAGWLVENTEAICKRSPASALTLFEAALADDTLRPDVVEAIRVRLARLLFWLGQDPREYALAVSNVTDDAATAAEMQWLLASTGYRNGDVAGAVAGLAAVAQDDSAPELWRARSEATLAMVQRAGRGDPVAAEITAASALRRGTSAGDVFVCPSGAVAGRDCAPQSSRGPRLRQQVSRSRRGQAGVG